MNNPDLSIIIPVYNAAKFIARCIESIINLNLINVEVILIDDGSTDDSVSICQSYITSYNWIRLLKKTNGGVSTARNKGLDVAKGKYIFFLDSDDFVTPEFRSIVDICVSQNLPFTFFKRKFLFRSTLEYNYRNLLKFMDKIDCEIYQIKNPEKILQSKIFCSGSGEILLKRDLIGPTRFDSNRSILEDFDFFFKILVNCPVIYFFDAVSIIIDDCVPNSLTKKRIKYSSKIFLAEYNPYLISRKKLQKRIYWIENYFDIKRLSAKGRIIHFCKTLFLSLIHI